MKLVANNIYKKIRGKEILKDINLTLESGRIYGFVGRNGSGKTMLFRALSGLMKTNEGTVSLDGQVLHKNFNVLPSLGIVLENAGLYPNMTGMDNLRYLASMKKMIGDEEISQAMIRVGLDPKDKRVYRKYSLGMKQRLHIAQAVMERPDIIMLDEPTNSLDEFGVEEIRNIILEEKERGALVLLASHNKDDIHKLVDKLYRIENGRVSEEKEERV